MLSQAMAVPQLPIEIWEKIIYELANAQTKATRATDMMRDIYVAAVACRGCASLECVGWTAATLESSVDSSVDSSVRGLKCVEVRGLKSRVEVWKCRAPRACPWGPWTSKY